VVFRFGLRQSGHQRRKFSRESLLVAQRLRLQIREGVVRGGVMGDVLLLLLLLLGAECRQLGLDYVRGSCLELLNSRQVLSCSGLYPPERSEVAAVFIGQLIEPQYATEQVVIAFG